MSNELPDGAIPIVPTAGSLSLNEKTDIAFDWSERQPVKTRIPGGGPNGRWVTMEEPSVAISQFVEDVMKDMSFKDANMMGRTEARITAFLHITAIDDEPVKMIKNNLDALKLEQRLGVRGTQIVLMTYAEKFGAFGELAIVEKK